jgi:adenylate kinase
MMVVLLGPPGAGKGTHADAIRAGFGIPHVSTGNMLRAAIEAGTPAGRRAKDLVERGELVPDDLMAEMVRERLGAQDALDGFILDGYPRNVGQARDLDGLLAQRGGGPDRVLSLVVDDEEIVRRLSGRRTCEECGAPYHVVSAPPKTDGRCDRCGGPLAQRADDRPEVIARRLAVYRAQTEPLVAFYRARGVLAEVDAAGPVEAVRDRVVGALR